MFSCALIGPDGAGKSTICAGLPGALPFPVKCIYMGVNPDAGNHLLPTTRLVRRVRRALGIAKNAGGPPALAAAAPPPRSGLRRWLREARSALWLVNRLGEEWYRQALAWYFQRRGYVVVFDRHYIADYHAHDMNERGADRPLARRLHGYLLRSFYPAPDLVVVLDAPVEALFARKPEGTLEALARRQSEYLSLEEVFPHVVQVDASQPRERVLDEVAKRITEFHERGRVEGEQRPSAEVG